MSGRIWHRVFKAAVVLWIMASLGYQPARAMRFGPVPSVGDVPAREGTR